MSDESRFDIAALLLRSGLGVMFIAHALLKIFVFTVPGTVQFFGSLGLPAVVAYATIAAELAGGIALLLGVYTRSVAFALVPILVGSLWVHAGNGWLFSAPNGGWEYSAFLTLVAVVVGLIGGGRYSVGATSAPAQRAVGGLQRAA
jgi:putative oxidoreductase